MFWGGARRLPIPIAFDPRNSLHIEFMNVAMRLRKRVYLSIEENSDGDDDHDTFGEYVVSNLPSRSPKDSEEIDNEVVLRQKVFDKLSERNRKVRRLFADNINPEEFEKDDLTLVDS